MSDTLVYWINRPSMTDIRTQGYIGITNNLIRRKNSHVNKPCNPHLGNALSKYDDIEFDVLFECSTLEDALAIELSLRPHSNIGWNCAKGGGIPPSWLGKKHSDESKLKMSINATGRVMNPEVVERVASKRRGSKRSLEANLRTSNTLTKFKFIGTCVKTGVVNEYVGKSGLKESGLLYSSVHRCLTGARAKYHEMTWAKELN